MNFHLLTSYSPAGDQPNAIQQLVKGTKNGITYQTLLGVTGSGKTFTMANVIEKMNMPTLILSHNKTLAAQLYGELKEFFPQNAVEYFISYYDYYQPEAYIPSSNTYIEKALAINEEIEKLRLSATASLLSGRKDVIVIASVSCIYGIGNPKEFGKNILQIHLGQKLKFNALLFSLVDMLYSKTENILSRGTFRIKGDIIDIYLAYTDYGYRLVIFDDRVEEIFCINPITGKKIYKEKKITIFPANLFVVGKDTIKKIINNIQSDLLQQIQYFEKENLWNEAKKIKDKTELDIEMMRELGYCPGIENYSRYIDQRMSGERPFCLLDYFPKQYLMMIDESHVTIPQIKAMYGGDRARKNNLIQYGFRLPSALDNRPLQFHEFEKLIHQVIFVSATPAHYELEKSEGVIIEQLLRPTGLLDPKITVKPTKNQIDDIVNKIYKTVSKKERILITTLTKKMAEELSTFFQNMGIKCKYIHSEIKTLERVSILKSLRLGDFDVLVGVNLLREGIDLPEVSLVIILDANKEGFLRNAKSLIQTIGRAARNANGQVIMYADTITASMKKAITETLRRRKVQTAHNKKYNIIPTTIKKSKDEILQQANIIGEQVDDNYSIENKNWAMVAAEEKSAYQTSTIDEKIHILKIQMEKEAKNLHFKKAALLRDKIKQLTQK